MEMLKAIGRWGRMSSPSLGENCAPWGGNEAHSTPLSVTCVVESTNPGLQETARPRAPGACHSRPQGQAETALRAELPPPLRLGLVAGRLLLASRGKRGGGVLPPHPSSLAASPSGGRGSCGGSLSPRLLAGTSGPGATLVRGARGLLLGPRPTQPLGSPFQSPGRHPGSPGARLRERGRRAACVRRRPTAATCRAQLWVL